MVNGDGGCQGDAAWIRALAVQYSDVGVKILRFGKYKTVY